MTHFYPKSLIPTWCEMAEESHDSYIRNCGHLENLKDVNIELKKRGRKPRALRLTRCLDCVHCQGPNQ